MAKRTMVVLVDDLDGSEATEEVRFALDGRSYEIDLSAANNAVLREALAPFISAARRTGSAGAAARSAPAVSPGPARSAADRAQNQAIRKWALGQGMKIAERGRLPSDVVAAYHRSHDGSPGGS